jgi:hypothetical protein
MRGRGNFYDNTGVETVFKTLKSPTAAASTIRQDTPCATDADYDFATAFSIMISTWNDSK